MAAEELHITIIQPHITWGNEQRTLAHISKIIADIPSCDLIVLPEMFHTGFSIHAQNAVDLNALSQNEVIKWMREWAAEQQAAICGSIKVYENGVYYNRFVLVQGDNITATYDKRHLFGLMGEDKLFTAGQKKIVFEIDGWRIQPFICYDLRFPAWCRNTDNADLQLYVANWPEKRAHHWKLLLQARAVENQCYVAGANAVGNDEQMNVYSGDSAVYAPDGELLCTLPGQSGYLSISLSMQQLVEHRERYPFLKDRDKFNFE